ncbi:MAG: S-methyl-5-thioribose-1-phosphate isomerase [Gemmatimonadetes bacterium]|nr:S-methyl-5-thioribose-1-phosphate isomerase [Gemmatimonadota bacterium]NNM05947.1 S-methyl-5-thioribose-1-phosphate isomerase [Gemmatimonadota bacterium]
MNHHRLFPSEIPVSVRWSSDGRAVEILDQTLLPSEELFLRLEDVEAVAEAISVLRVRGAPAIGIAAAMGLALGTLNRIEAQSDPPSVSRLKKGFLEDAELLRCTRPTAVNLSWALDRQRRVVEAHAARGSSGGLKDALISEADRIAAEDREMCRRIGEAGVELIPEVGAGILTHCNAGALATGGIGTALAPVYIAHTRGVPLRLYAGETRPLLQGARLTAWEASRAGVDVTIITDSMAGALMKQGSINLVIVGADRVAANGDVANKIGTYPLAVLANHHAIPFFVALPRSTFDLHTPDGGSIPIEVRGPTEVEGTDRGRRVPDGVEVWNPAFDVTPASLVTAFVTDGGILRPPYEPAVANLLKHRSGDAR